MSDKNGGGAIRVLVVSASAVRRAGLETIIKTTPPLKLVSSAHGISALSAQAREFQPDIILADLERADPNFIALVSSIWQAHAAPIFVILIDAPDSGWTRSEEHTSELQSRLHLVCRLLLEKKKKDK